MPQASTLIALCSRAVAPPPCVVHAFSPVFELRFFAPLLKVTLSSLSEQQARTLQHRALFLLTDTQLSFLDNLIDVYQLTSARVAVLQQHIVRLQSLNLYKEVRAQF